MQIGLTMEIIYYLLVGILVGFIVWFLMIQREKKVLLEAQMESSLKLAAAEEKERAREDSLKQYESAMKDSFTLLAQSAFEEAVAKADAEKENAFSSATESLSKSLSEYTKNIEKIEKDSIDRGARLEKTIEAVGELGLKLSDETSNLTRALKADSQAQGAWGELVLENLLQSLGFQKERDYSTQTTFTQADGTRPRTDFIVELPDNRQIIIDSKVSLTAWERYVNAEQDSDMESALKDHCQSIRNHAKDLASKNYHTLEGINTVEFVLMYVPLESAFSAAMKLHPDLYMEFATSNHVRIVTGSTIVTTLLLIKELWKREAQTKNQARLIEESGKLHDQIVRFLDSFQKIGHELNQATEAYHLAMERLVEGRGNVLKRTDNLKQLGAKVTKEISKNLLQEANQHHESASDSNDSG
ncbi:MAG: DNA recombination protein RmuC [Euryarchaeota archaeon]|nr:DNA recombination protein RmuC [Euryarchaeota archaeon]